MKGARPGGHRKWEGEGIQDLQPGYLIGGRRVGDSDAVSRWLAHNSTGCNVDLLNFRVRNENG